MTAAVSAGREVRPFRLPDVGARSFPNQKSFDEGDEDGLVLEQPLRESQKSERNPNNEIISSHQSRKRPLSLPPQAALRQSQYDQTREPKSEPWPSDQRLKQRTEDSSISHSHRDRHHAHSKELPPSNRCLSRQNNNDSSHSDRDKMCNTPFRRNGAATYQSRNSKHEQDSNRGQFDFKQGRNAARQQHRWQGRSEVDCRDKNTGEYRVNDRGECNRNLPTRREEEKRGLDARRLEDRGAWSDRRLEGRKGWNDRRPGDWREDAQNRSGERRDWNERRPGNEADRNRPKLYHERQAPLRRPYDDRRDNCRRDWRDSNEQVSRSNGTHSNSYLQGSRVPQERNTREYQKESPRHQEYHYRNERPRDHGFRPHKSTTGSWVGESTSNRHLQSQHPSNQVPRPTQSDKMNLEANERLYNDVQNIQAMPSPPSLSPQSRQYNQSTPTLDYSRNCHGGNDNYDRCQSHDEYQENLNMSRDALVDRYSDRNRSQFVCSNSQPQRSQLQQPSEQDNRRYEYSCNAEPRVFQEKQPQSLEKPTLRYNAPPTYTAKVIQQRAVKPKVALESKVTNKTKFGIRPTAQHRSIAETSGRSLSSSNTSKPANVAIKPATESRKIEPATKSTLGIPMRWLKPNVKPKKPVKRSFSKEQGSIEKKKECKKVNAAIPRISKVSNIERVNGLMSSPSHRSPSANRLVTDSEGGSTLSNMKEVIGESIERSSSNPKVPRAIVTKLPVNSKIETKDDDLLKSDNDSLSVDDLKRVPKPHPVLRTSTSSSAYTTNIATSDDSDSDTDDEEVMMWASKMFGVPFRPSDTSPSELDGRKEESSPMKKLRLKLKLPRPERQSDDAMKDVGRPKMKTKTSRTKRKRSTDMECDRDAVVLPLKKRKGKPKKRKSIGSDSYIHEETEERRIRKESAKPLTAEQIKTILGEDDFAAPGGSNWVRRSVRQPSKALLSAKPLRMLIEKLKHNDPEVVVLKMKKYINDPNAPSVVLDAALDALEENTNCQTLYIQNFNEGMRDKQVIHLLRILQNPKCKIWCLNIGENYNVKTRTWDKFTKGLKKTKITHMYASEHTITTEMKDEIRASIRNNRQKHDMHINPENLHVIVQCTHCWWNPINAKVLRPYLKKEGFEHILADREAQGLRGSSSAAPSI
ncbi:unnamed protein product [Cylindrotheca closterium]|uniref:Uncharacterized protein n=1 Tax=Cylindrotheca closterium TaxID=2856 RepID=A0AAD2GCZ1_9STRA|nr:unnamed protein product [Cylindrotheca closterium]